MTKSYLIFAEISRLLNIMKSIEFAIHIRNYMRFASFFFFYGRLGVYFCCFSDKLLKVKTKHNFNSIDFASKDCFALRDPSGVQVMQKQCESLS